MKDKLITDIEDKLKKENHSTVLKFIGATLSVIAVLIIGILKYSPLEKQYTFGLAIVFSLLFIFIILYTIIKSIKNPAPFIFNQNAYLTYLREDLGDSNSKKTYYTDSESVVSINNEYITENDKIDLIEPIKPTKKITKAK